MAGGACFARPLNLHLFQPAGEVLIGAKDLLERIGGVVLDQEIPVKILVGEHQAVLVADCGDLGEE